jgi:hypothetical protein
VFGRIPFTIVLTSLATLPGARSSCATGCCDGSRGVLRSRRSPWHGSSRRRCGSSGCGYLDPPTRPMTNCGARTCRRRR